MRMCTAHVHACGTTYMYTLKVGFTISQLPVLVQVVKKSVINENQHSKQEFE